MRPLALFFLFLPLLGFARSEEYVEVAKLKASEAHLQQVVAEIRWIYRDNAEFISAFDVAQKKWEDYCEAMMRARFPAKNQIKEYGSAFPIAYAAVKRPMVEDRIKELSLWTTGTEEGDVSKGSVKWKSELDAIRGKKAANQPLQGTPGKVPSSSTEPEARRP